ncbi:S-layer family protein [Anaerobacterium chartisolvens]|uniref:S-layer family protein n=1 Tax=Anaerobacterium chartisolvens TaxID=1297424 RepID=A0A369BHX1_9FIRM|nr:S-layer homology domain-containing protein [Anaerobacterium chartisolvens]RCX19274.1 S-layer family protein [Anaerobacterium chartisolvens]
MKKLLALIVAFAMLLMQIPGMAFAADSDVKRAIDELNNLTKQQKAALLSNVWDFTFKELNNSQQVNKQDILDEIERELRKVGLWDKIISDTSGNDGKISKASLDVIVQELIDNKAIISDIYRSFEDNIDMQVLKTLFGLNTHGEVFLKLIDLSGPVLTSDSNGKFISKGNVVQNALGSLAGELFDQDEIEELNRQFKTLADKLNDYVAQYKVDKNDVIHALNIYGLYAAPPTGGGDSGVIIGGGSSSETPPPSESSTVKQGLIEFKAVLDSKGAAKATVTQKLFDKALGTAEVGNDGVKTVEIKIDAVKGAKQYVPQLPASVLASDKQDVKIKIETPLGTLSVPGNMFNKEDAAGVSNIQISIGISGASGINDEAAAEAIGTRPVIELGVMADGKARAWSNPDVPVTFSVKYAPSDKELGKTDFLTVLYIDGSGKAFAVPNARFNAGAGTVDFSTTHFSKYAVAYVYKTFDDAAKYSWAKTAIEVVASRGITDGISEDTFDPDGDITRAEFLAGLIKTLGLSAKFDANFDDVKPDNKFYNEIGIAKQLKITEGPGNNRFGTDTVISRQDMMVFISKAMKLAGKNGGTGTDSDLEKFSDKDKIASYAKDSVALLVKNKIIQGNGNNLNPTGKVTRAASAVTLYRLSKL